MRTYFLFLNIYSFELYIFVKPKKAYIDKFCSLVMFRAQLYVVGYTTRVMAHLGWRPLCFQGKDTMYLGVRERLNLTIYFYDDKQSFAVTLVRTPEDIQHIYFFRYQLWGLWLSPCSKNIDFHKMPWLNSSMAHSTAVDCIDCSCCGPLNMQLKQNMKHNN